MNTSVGLAVALALVASGCGKDKKGEGDGAAKTSSTSGKGDGKPTAALFSGTVPTLPATVADFKFGMPKADAEKLLEEKKLSVLDYDLDYDRADKLEKISIKADEDLEPGLTKIWGTPIKTAAVKGTFWFAPEAGLRANLVDYAKGKTVQFEPYEPLEKVLGEKGTGFAFANGTSLIGSSIDELKAALGDRLCKFDEEAPKMKAAFAEAEKDLLSGLRDANKVIRICTTVPRTVELTNTLGDQARFGLDGKLASIFVSFNTGQSGEMLKQLAEKTNTIYGGKPVEVKGKYGLERYYFDPATKQRVKVMLGEQSVNVELSHYLPLAELFGGDKPGLSVEGAHMPVGTQEQVKADDPEHYAQRGESAFLYYPPTEYGQANTEVQIEQYAKQKKSYGYRINLHHTDNEAAGDQVFDLLKAKFGEPKVDKRTTDKDKYWTFSKNGRKVEARRISQQWQILVTK